MTGWFRDYVYFPFGGSRCAPRHLLNLMIVFLVSGLWHGADRRYLVWGLSRRRIGMAQLTKAAPRWPGTTRTVCWRWIQRCIVYLFCLRAPGGVFCRRPAPTPIRLRSTRAERGWQSLGASWAEVLALMQGAGIKRADARDFAVGTLVVFAAESQAEHVDADTQPKLLCCAGRSTTSLAPPSCSLRRLGSRFSSSAILRRRQTWQAKHRAPALLAAPLLIGLVRRLFWRQNAAQVPFAGLIPRLWCL